MTDEAKMKIIGELSHGVDIAKGTNTSLVHIRAENAEEILKFLLSIEHMDDWTEFAEWLKRTLAEKGLSTRTLEKMYGISHHTTQDYTRQKRAPNIDTFLRIANALGKKIIIIDEEGA